MTKRYFYLTTWFLFEYNPEQSCPWTDLLRTDRPCWHLHSCPAPDHHRFFLHNKWEGISIGSSAQKFISSRWKRNSVERYVMLLVILRSQTYKDGFMVNILYLDPIQVHIEEDLWYTHYQVLQVRDMTFSAYFCSAVNIYWYPDVLSLGCEINIKIFSFSSKKIW